MMFTATVNAVCINVPFSAPTLGCMHESMKRLLDFARETTRNLPGNQRVESFSDLGARLNVSSAVLTNWKARGISKEGALDAQRLWGVNALWLLEELTPASIYLGGAPLSQEVLRMLASLSADDVRRAENQLRAFLDMEALPRTAPTKRTGTAG